MTTTDDNDLSDLASWKLFVARATSQIRAELGENAASRLSTLLLDAQDPAIAAAREEAESTLAQLAAVQAEVITARKSHERLQLDMTRMEAAIRSAKEDAARIRAEVEETAVRRRAEIDAVAESEAAKLASERDELRAQEAEVANRRAELLELEERVSVRHDELDAVEAELQEFRATIEAEQIRAAELLGEAMNEIDSREADAERQVEAARREADEAADVIDLRDDELRKERLALVERERELDEREAALDRRAQIIDVTAPDEETADGRAAGWGRNRRLD